MMKVPYYTTLAGARAAVEGIDALARGELDVCALQDYRSAEAADDLRQPDATA